jgi:uracil-DNA glycosylase
MPRCAVLWRRRLLAEAPNVELTLLVGSYAHAWTLGKSAKRSVTETVRAWRDYPANVLPMPHPSWRNTGWLKRNPWFETQVAPYLRDRVSQIIGP